MTLKVMVDMDDVICDFKGAYERDLIKYPNQPYPGARGDFFRTLEPIDHSLAVMAMLEGTVNPLQWSDLPLLRLDKVAEAV